MMKTSNKMRDYKHGAPKHYSVTEERKRISEWLKKQGLSKARGHKELFAGNKERKEQGE